MNCKTCGDDLCGDGYTRVFHCVNASDTDVAPDSNPVHCTEADCMDLTALPDMPLSEFMAMNCAGVEPARQHWIKPGDEDKGAFAEELWDALIGCEHDIQPASGGGVKCTKCGGWYCF